MYNVSVIIRNMFNFMLRQSVFVLAKISEEAFPSFLFFKPFYLDEILQGNFTKKGIRCGEACGKDSLTPEFLKYAGLDDLVLGLLNEVFSDVKIIIGF